MEILFLLIPLSVLLVGIAIGIFIWAVRNGQFDDLDSPAWRILVEDHRDNAAGKRQDPAREDAQENDSRRDGNGS